MQERLAESFSSQKHHLPPLGQLSSSPFLRALRLVDLVWLVLNYMETLELMFNLSPL